MTFDRAIEAANDLRTLLEAEEDRARTAREQLRSFDPEALFAFAREREGFGRRAEELKLALADALESAARASGLTSVTFLALRELGDENADRLVEALEAVRARAESLRSVDAFNRDLAARTGQVLRGALASLTRGADGYDRRGARYVPPAAVGQHSRRA